MCYERLIWHLVRSKINIDHLLLLIMSFFFFAAKLAKPSDDTTMEDASASNESLPQTLVRIPTEHAPTLQAQADAIEAAAVEGDSTAST